MRQFIKFLLLLIVPYGVCLSSMAAVGGGFLFPQTVFPIVGPIGYVSALIATAVSLIVIFKTNGRLRSLGHEINRRHAEETADQ